VRLTVTPAAFLRETVTEVFGITRNATVKGFLDVRPSSARVLLGARTRLIVLVVTGPRKSRLGFFLNLSFGTLTVSSVNKFLSKRKGLNHGPHDPGVLAQSSCGQSGSLWVSFTNSQEF